MLRVPHPRPMNFANPDEWHDWLEMRHATTTEAWLRLAKKKTGIPSIDWEQAVEEALIWGWIDGTKKAESETHWLQRFTPRARNSVWSEKNRATAERLIAGGWMQEPGLAEVEKAKADGRWDAAYRVKGSTVPDDLQAALDAGAQVVITGRCVDSAVTLALAREQVIVTSGATEGIADAVLALPAAASGEV